jgi:hypothetical protein
MAEQIKDTGRSLWCRQRRARGRRDATRHVRHPGVPGHEADHLNGSPYEECGGRTSGRTCVARFGPGCCAWTCWSGSCGACSLRMQASPRCVPLREPFLLGDAVTEKRSGRRARRNRAKNSALPCATSHGKDSRDAKAPHIRAPSALQVPNRPQLGPEPSLSFPASKANLELWCGASPKRQRATYSATT